MSNKSKGKRMNDFKPEMFRGGVQQMPDPKAQQAVQMLQTMKASVRKEVDKELFINPQEQIIDEHEICWVWQIAPARLHIVQARYIRANKTYYIELMQTVESPHITPDD